VRRIRTKQIHQRALAMPMLEGHDTTKGIERRVRKIMRAQRQTNGKATPARQWPAASHNFSRCADCRRGRMTHEERLIERQARIEAGARAAANA